MKKLITIIITVQCSVFSVHWASAQIINVPADQPTIQAGINAANNGDLLLVAPGTYYENIRFMGKAITVASHFINSGDTNDINNTIIDGSAATKSDSSSVVTFVHGEDTTSILQGFTLTGGSGTFLATFQCQAGGGVYAYNSGCKLLNNKIMDNHVEGDLAGAVGISVISFIDGVWAVIRDNVIKYNTSIAHGFTAFGGGMSVTSNALIEHNVIMYNVINNDSEYADGGGIELEKDTPEVPQVVVRNNIISYNEVHAVLQAFGGGINSFSVPAVITNNVISNNTVTGDDQTYGGGIHVTGSAGGINIHSNIIENNACSSDYAYGAGICILNSGHSIVEDNQINHNAVATNMGGGGGAIVVSQPVDSVIILHNTITSNTQSGTSYGGGLFIDQFYDVPLLVSRNLIQDNNCNNNGGGIFTFNSYNGVICNNLFKYNDASQQGGAIFFRHYGEASKQGSHPLVVNNTFMGNIAWRAAGVYTDHGAEVPVFMNNIFWQNEASNQANDIFNAGTEQVIIRNCNIDEDEISGFWTGQDNFNKTQVFLDSTCHLHWASPCIGQGIDYLVAHGTVFYCPGDDYDGEMRPQAGAVDIGADESPLWVGVDELQVAGCGMEVYPNPTSGITNLRYRIPDAGYRIPVTRHASRVTSINLHSIDGRKVMEIEKGTQAPGEYEIQLDLGNLPDGVYLVRMTVGEESTVRKVILSK